MCVEKRKSTSSYTSYKHITATNSCVQHRLCLESVEVTFELPKNIRLCVFFVELKGESKLHLTAGFY